MYTVCAVGEVTCGVELNGTEIGTADAEKVAVKELVPLDPPPVPLTTLNALLLCVVSLVHPVGAADWTKSFFVPAGYIQYFEFISLETANLMPVFVKTAILVK